MSLQDMELLTPFTIGGQELKNRLVLAPLTRARTPNRIPNELNVLYYTQRASAGLVITEATGISEMGYGWGEAAAIYNDEQAAGWKNVVDSVHEAGGLIYLQLWHMGRQSHSSYHESKDIVSASAIAVGEGQATALDGSKHDYEVPRALTIAEIKATVQDYKAAAQRCLDAGFDGVEIHSANGYLVDQFFQSCSNQRDDEYGGSFENRARFFFEIVDAISEVYPVNRIGFRLSPNGAFGGMGSSDNFDFFTYVAAQAEGRGLAYLHLMDGLGFGFHGKCKQVRCSDIRKVFSGPIIGNVGLTRDIAEGLIRSGAMDLAAFGRLYISNPDLAARFQNNWPLNPDATYPDWWTRGYGAKGYTDFPFYEAEEKKSQ